MGAPAGKNFEIVAVIGIVLVAISLGERPRDDFTKGAFIIPAIAAPIQPVALAWRTNDLLRVIGNAAWGSILVGVITFGFDVAAANLNGVKFIAADAPHEDLLLPPCRVEVPQSVHCDDRNGQRPFIVADQKRFCVLYTMGRDQPHLLGGAAGEAAADFSVGDGIASGQDALC